VLLPPNGAKKNKVSVVGKCNCGGTIMHDDNWPDSHIVECEKCGASLGDYGNYKSEAARFVAEFIEKLK
jgi:hypothetical protein